MRDSAALKEVLPTVWQMLVVCSTLVKMELLHQRMPLLMSKILWNSKKTPNPNTDDGANEVIHIDGNATQGPIGDAGATTSVSTPVTGLTGSTANLPNVGVADSSLGANGSSPSAHTPVHEAGRPCRITAIYSTSSSAVQAQ